MALERLQIKEDSDAWPTDNEEFQRSKKFLKAYHLADCLVETLAEWLGFEDEEDGDATCYDALSPASQYLNASKYCGKPFNLDVILGEKLMEEGYLTK